MFNTVQVREVVMGFDVTNESFRDGFGSNVQAVLDRIANFMNTDEASASTGPNALYLRDGFVQQVTGKIIIRTSVASDPYADANGNADVTTGILSDFRARWNFNQDATPATGVTLAGDTARTQNNHQIAQLLGGSAGTADGWGYVGTINETSRYSVSDATNPGYWMGVARHEIGHNYGLGHFSGSNRREEFNPAGIGIGIFDPTGNRSGLTTDEAITIHAEINSSNLPLINLGTANEGTFTDHTVRPVAVRDDVTSDGTPTTIDILANDKDVNNDLLYLESYNNVTLNGGSVAPSIGTGSQGHDQLIYTPPVGFTGTDSFYYRTLDTSGYRNNGIVTVEVSGGTVVDLNATSYQYDLGPDGSPVKTGHTAITPDTFGDINWTGGAFPALDRGTGVGDNALRDIVYSNTSKTFNHTIANGLWRVTLNMGDTFLHDLMGVRAEGTLINDSITSPANQYSFVDENGASVTPTSFDVSVTDGELNLEFFDNGGADANWVLNRIALERLLDVDLSQDFYRYDFGPASSPVLPGYTAITPESDGEINWTGGALDSRDRGDAVGDNGNRDIVFASGQRSFNHIIDNGIWRVTLVMGDTTRHDSMSVSAESNLISDQITSNANNYNFVDENGASATPTSFEVTVTDGELNLEFDDVGGIDSNWVVNTLELERLITVDTSLTEYLYDLGTATSPVLAGHTAITPDTAGEINWTGNPFPALDRGPGVSNESYRDLVYSNTPTTFNHKIANGLWRVTLNMGDTLLHDLMGVRAEGNLISDNITSAPNQYSFVDENGASANATSFDVAVTDGELNLEFSDNGGSDANWVLNRIALQRGVSVDLAETEYFYDLGTATSPIFTGNADPYQRISPETFGDISFVSGGPNPVEARDRIANGNAQNSPNDLNRDHIRMRSASTFNHVLAPGVYDVLLTIGDAAENTNPIRFTAEGSNTFTTLPHTPGTHTNYTFNDVLVVDGALTLDIENLGFSANINRIRITRQATPPPVLTSFTRFNPSEEVTNADTLVFRAAFDKEVLGVDASDFAVNGSTATVSSVMPVQGTGESVYEVTVTGGDLQSLNGIVGIDLVAGQNITDVTLNPLPSDQPSIDETFNLDNIAPEVTEVTFDDGTQQRSVVRSIAIDFDSDISFAAGAFEVRNSGGTLIDTSSSVAAGTVTSQVVLTFPGTTGGSLDDGNYQLTVKRELVKDAAGNTLENDRVDDFFRFFGDTDGDRDVDGQDYGRFGLSFLKSTGQTGFNTALDLNNDGDVDGQDYGNFGLRFLQSLRP